jgi:ATP-dependent RNA helicase HelY
MTHRNTIIQEKKELLDGLGSPEKAEFVADEFQRAAIDSIAQFNDTLVVAPTGAGKTYIATEAISAFLSLNSRSVYTTPLKALSNTKYVELKRRFEPKYKVGILTGDRKIDGDADVVVATTEIYRNELYRGSDRHSLVILDEVHYLADPQRGPVWEESIILTPKASTLLMLSASISNAEEIAAWLQEVRGKPCNIVRAVKRPVELRYGFLHAYHGVIPLRDNRGRIHKEVLSFYGSMQLDRNGTRLSQKDFRPRDGGGRSGRRGRRR